MKVVTLKISMLLIGLILLSGSAHNAVYAETLIWAPQELEQIINEGLENNKEIQRFIGIQADKILAEALENALL